MTEETIRDWEDLTLVRGLSSPQYRHSGRFSYSPALTVAGEAPLDAVEAIALNAAEAIEGDGDPIAHRATQLSHWSGTKTKAP